MSSTMQPNRNAQPFKILSLDDSGVGGLSGLLILENIMENIRDAEGLLDMPKPCERFDLIGGTGTGGIIAIMLGRLGMPIGDCIEAYKKICSAAFPPRQHYSSLGLQAKSTSSISTTNLENALKKVIRENCPHEECMRERKVGKPTGNTCQHENEKFLHHKCAKTVVLATADVNINARPILFKTYQATASWSECKIWEVGRATSAISNLFKPIKLGRESETFMNSSFGHSNPCKVLINEASKLSDYQEMLILSIGTGLSDVVDMSDDENSLTNALKKIAANSQEVADELERKYHCKRESYHRFDTANDQEAIPASNRLELSEVVAHSQNYINNKQPHIKSFTNILLNRFPLVSEQPERPDGPVPVYYIPFHKNPKFVGRQEILSRLDSKLFIQTGFQQTALVGLGGMGKTQIALKLAYMVRVKYPDYSIFWLKAASMDGFRNSCRELTAVLKIESSHNEDPRLLVKNYLDANVCGKWLLILDNVDDASLFEATGKDNRISSFLPRSEKGRIMFTTRSKKVSWLAVQGDDLEIDEMSSTDLTAILIRSVKELSHGPHTRHRVQINELLNELCHLPLAVAQAADFMAATQISISQYLELLRESNEEKIALLRHGHMDKVHMDDSQGAVVTTWLIAFRQIQKTSSDAVKLLQFIAHVDSKAIPLAMLPGFEKSSMVEAIKILSSYGFIRGQSQPNLFDMHSLVHSVAQMWCNRLRDKKKQGLAVLDHMTSIFPGSTWENRFLWRQYLPHALRVVEIEKASEVSIPRLAFKLGKCLRSDGNTQEAVKMLEHVVKMEEQALSFDHPERLESQSQLAQAYLDDGQIEKAVLLLEHVVHVQGVLAANHPSRLASQHALARAYRADGQIKIGDSMVEAAVKTIEEAPAANHPDRLTSQHNLARQYYAYGQSQASIELLRCVVELDGMSLDIVENTQ